MNKKILVFNAGSSSLKYKLFEFENDDIVLLKSGIVENIGEPNGPKNHKAALSILFQGFGAGAPYLGKIENLAAIGHRVVHCGDEFSEPTLISKDVIRKLQKYNLLAPLHNPHILEVMEDIINHSGQKGHRDIPNYAIFDSTYFKDIPEVTKVYPIPYKYFKEYKIHRYGFHGISHEFVVTEILKKYPNAQKIISIHLGAGASIAAVKDRKPIDISMGFTPLEGLMMSTRSGDLDAGIIHYLIEKRIIRHQDVDEMLNLSSGLLGISGTDSDMRELLYVAGYPMEDPNYSPKTHKSYIEEEKIYRAKLAIEMFIYRIKKYIGAYNAILGGVDVLIFTGRMAIGSGYIRTQVLKNLDFLIKNTKIEVIETDEEKQISREIISLLGK